MLAESVKELETSDEVESHGVDSKGISLWYLPALAAHKYKAQLWQAER